MCPEWRECSPRLPETTIIDNHAIEMTLNQYSKDGWELVTVLEYYSQATVPPQPMGARVCAILIIKKPDA